MPVGPSNTAIPAVTSRRLQPSSGVGLISGEVVPFCKGGDDGCCLVSRSSACDSLGNCCCLVASSLCSERIAAATGAGGAGVIGSGWGSPAPCAGTCGTGVKPVCLAVTSTSCVDFVFDSVKNKPSDETLLIRALAPSAWYCCQANAIPKPTKPTIKRGTKLLGIRMPADEDTRIDDSAGCNLAPTSDRSSSSSTR